MSYRRSAARESFEKRVDQLRLAAKIAATKSRKIPSQVREIAFHAAIFETSAALEVYIKALLEDYKFRAKQSELPLWRVPDTIRTYLLIKKTRPHFENLTFRRDEKRALTKLDINSDFFEVLNPNALVSKHFDIVSILGEKKYPSPENWEKLFLRLGIKNVYGIVNSRLRRDSKSLLESFNDVRTALAHDEPPNLTYKDIKRHLQNMKAFINGVDRVLCSHFCSYSGRESWPKA